MRLTIYYVFEMEKFYERMCCFQLGNRVIAEKRDWSKNRAITHWTLANGHTVWAMIDKGFFTGF